MSTETQTEKTDLKRRLRVQKMCKTAYEASRRFLRSKGCRVDPPWEGAGDVIQLYFVDMTRFVIEDKNRTPRDVYDRLREEYPCMSPYEEIGMGDQAAHHIACMTLSVLLKRF